MFLSIIIPIKKNLIPKKINLQKYVHSEHFYTFLFEGKTDLKISYRTFSYGLNIIGCGLKIG